MQNKRKEEYLPTLTHFLALSTVLTQYAKKRKKNAKKRKVE